MQRHDLNMILAALVLLLGAVSLDQYLARRYPHNSPTLTVMELRSGGTTAKEKIAIRRSDVEAVVAMVADPADPLALTPEERAHALQQLQLIESLLTRAMWAADRLRDSLTDVERGRVDEARRDRFLMNQAQRAGPRYFDEQLAEAYRMAPPPPALPPAGWSPDEDPGLLDRWEELRRGGEGYVSDSLLEIDAPVLVLAVALDQKEHPVRGPLAEERYALARSLAECIVNVDEHWKNFYAILLVSGSGRGEILPVPSTEVPPPGQDDDLTLPDLIRAMREHLRQLEKRV